MFVIVGAGGPGDPANLKPIAADLKIDASLVTLIGLTMTTGSFAATIDRIPLERPAPSLLRVDFRTRSARENTMFIAFGMEGDRHLSALHLGPAILSGSSFSSGAVFFAWGEIYSLSPPRPAPIRSAQSSLPPPTRTALTPPRERPRSSCLFAQHPATAVGFVGHGVPHRRGREHPGFCPRHCGSRSPGVRGVVRRNELRASGVPVGLTPAKEHGRRGA